MQDTVLRAIEVRKGEEEGVLIVTATIEAVEEPGMLKVETIEFPVAGPDTLKAKLQADIPTVFVT